MPFGLPDYKELGRSHHVRRMKQRMPQEPYLSLRSAMQTIRICVPCANQFLSPPPASAKASVGEDGWGAELRFNAPLPGPPRRGEGEILVAARRSAFSAPLREISLSGRYHAEARRTQRLKIGRLLAVPPSRLQRTAKVLPVINRRRGTLLGDDNKNESRGSLSRF